MNSVVCPECKKSVDGKSAVCTNCGMALKKTEKCPECGQTVEKEADECSFCGFPLKKEKKRKKIRTTKISLAVAIPVLVIAIVSLVVTGISVGGIVVGKTITVNKIEEELIVQSPIHLVNSKARVNFRDDGTMVYFDFFIEDNNILNGYELTSSVAQYKVKGKNKLKINGETVNFTIRDDGKIIFEPDIATVLKNTANENEGD